MIRTLMLSVAAATTLVLAIAPGAHAATVLTCGAAEVTSFSPGLTNTPQPTTTTTSSYYQPCVNVTNPLELRTGTGLSVSGPASRSCTSLLGSGSRTRTIHWSTGTTSTWSYVSTTNFLAGGAGQITQQGSITAGEFQGATAVGVIVDYSGALAQCDSSGLASFGGQGALTITQ